MSTAITTLSKAPPKYTSPASCTLHSPTPPESYQDRPPAPTHPAVRRRKFALSSQPQLLKIISRPSLPTSPNPPPTPPPQPQNLPQETLSSSSPTSLFPLRPLSRPFQHLSLATPSSTKKPIRPPAVRSANPMRRPRRGIRARKPIVVFARRGPRREKGFRLWGLRAARGAGSRW